MSKIFKLVAFILSIAAIACCIACFADWSPRKALAFLTLPIAIIAIVFSVLGNKGGRSKTGNLIFLFCFLALVLSAVTLGTCGICPAVVG